MLGVLTIKLYLLSKPVTPIVAGAVASKAFDVLRCKDSAKNGKRKIEREEISYLVKIDVKIDDTSNDDDDKDYYDDDLKGADELANDDSDDEPADDSSDFDM